MAILTPKLKKYSMTNESNLCKYCNKEYKKMSTMSVHVCEGKRRHLAKDEKHVRIAFYAFVRFYELNHRKMPGRTYDDFAKSPYYNQFIKFGSHVSNSDPLYPNQFVDWIVQSNLKLDQWCNDALYYRYIRNLIQIESVETALERSVSSMQAWAKKTNSDWDQYFKTASSDRAAYDFSDGKISPWLFLNCKSGVALLQHFDNDQIKLVEGTVDAEFWHKQFKQKLSDLKLVKEIIKEAKL
jgi:hypothetical protein